MSRVKNTVYWDTQRLKPNNLGEAFVCVYLQRFCVLLRACIWGLVWVICMFRSCLLLVSFIQRAVKVNLGRIGEFGIPNVTAQTFDFYLWPCHMTDPAIWLTTALEVSEEPTWSSSVSKDDLKYVSEDSHRALKILKNVLCRRPLFSGKCWQVVSQGNRWWACDLWVWQHQLGFGSCLRQIMLFLRQWSRWIPMHIPIHIASPNQSRQISTSWPRSTYGGAELSVNRNCREQSKETIVMVYCFTFVAFRSNIG